MSRVEFVPTVPAHITELANANVPFRVKAVTAMVDGRVIGIGGIGYPKDGMPTAFACLTDELRQHKIALHKIGKRFRDEWVGSGMTVMALADQSIPAAERWLERYGFERQSGNVFVLRPDRG